MPTWPSPTPSGGEDLLSSTPRALLVAEALGATPPTYAHLPLLVNEQRKKLSKRRDDVSLEGYRKQGFLAEAMANYLALLGWGPRDGVEIRPMAEIIEQFRLEDVNKAPAFFDIAKLEHFNGVYIRELDPETFLAALEPHLTGEDVPWPPDRFRPDVVAAMAPLVQEKLRTLDGIIPQLDWLFLAEPIIDEQSWEKAVVRGKAAPEILDATIARPHRLPLGLRNRQRRRLRRRRGPRRKPLQIPSPRPSSRHRPLSRPPTLRAHGEPPNPPRSPPTPPNRPLPPLKRCPSAGIGEYTGRCFREWCNWQHTGFWSRYWGFESSLPSQLTCPHSDFV